MISEPETLRGTEHRRVLARLRRAALGLATDRELAELARHLRWCVGCRALFDRQVGVDRELARLGGAEVQLVPIERELARVAILDATSSTVTGQRGLSRRWWAALAIAAATALVLMALLPVLHRLTMPPGREATPDELAPRGVSGLALRLFCVDASAAQQQFRSARQQGPEASCHLHESLKLAYLNGTRLHRYLWVVGLDSDLAIKWYYPAPPASSGLAIRQSRTLEPLPDMITLRVNHRPGLVRVFGIFSPEKISSAQIEAAVRRLREQRQALPSIRALPLGVTAEQIASDLRVR